MAFFGDMNSMRNPWVDPENPSARACVRADLASMSAIGDSGILENSHQSREQHGGGAPSTPLAWIVRVTPRDSSAKPNYPRA
jgi:hypothetical protein